jgi:signal transduction histidine kinase
MTALLAGLALFLGAAALALARGLRDARRRVAALEERIRALDATPRPAPDGHDLATIAHELRSPLSAILGYQELLADGLLGSGDPHGREAIDRIGKAALRLQRVLDAAIEVARLETGIARPQFASAAVDRILADAVDQGRSLANPPALTLLIPDSPLPPTPTDPARLRLALDLALAAAIRATPDGEIRARAGSAPDGTPFIDLAGTALAPIPIPAPADPIASPADRPAAPLLLAARLVHSLGGRLTLVAEAGATTLRIALPAHRPND